MKFTVDRDTLMKEIAIASEIISSKNTLSVLSNVLLWAEDGNLGIRATDLKVSFETQIPVEVETAGRTTVYCDKLLGILRSLPQGGVVLEHAHDHVTITPTARKADFRLRSIPADKYPEIQLTSTESYWELPQSEFIEMITHTAFAVSDDETRYFMNGVYFEQLEGDLVMVATDGRRLSYIKKTPDGNVPEFNGVIVPPKILNLVRKLASGEGAIAIAVTEKHLFVEFENQKLSSALIEGQFPNYRRVIPETQEYTLTADRAQLAEALKRVSLLVEKSRRIYLTLAEDQLTLSSDESEIGTASEQLVCEYSGPEMKIALNFLYLSEPLRVIESDSIVLRFSEPNKALLLVPNPEQDYFHIVMPMQLD